MSKFLFITFLLIASAKINAAITQGDTLKGKVIKIVDGDTFDLLTEGMITLRIRMNGIDCPESKQANFKLSKEALGNYIFGKTVWIVIRGKDRWNRSLADVYLGKKNINYEMVKNGFAWHFIKYSNDKELAGAEKIARKFKKGLWQTPNPIPPWLYRQLARRKVLLK